MLSIEECTEHLSGLDLSDEQIEVISTTLCTLVGEVLGEVFKC